MISILVVNRVTLDPIVFLLISMPNLIINKSIFMVQTVYTNPRQVTLAYRVKVFI